MTVVRYMEIERVERALRRAKLARAASRAAPGDHALLAAHARQALQIGGMLDDLEVTLRLARRGAHHERCIAHTRSQRAAKKAAKAAGGEATC